MKIILKDDNDDLILSRNQKKINVFDDIERIKSILFPPIPVEGSVQIFADPECTQYPTGSVTKLYARVNEPWYMNESWIITKGDITFTAGGPGEGYETDPYCIGYSLNVSPYTAFWSKDYYEADGYFNRGEVVELTSDAPMDVTGKQFIFSSNES